MSCQSVMIPDLFLFIDVLLPSSYEIHIFLLLHAIRSAGQQPGPRLAGASRCDWHNFASSTKPNHHLAFVVRWPSTSPLSQQMALRGGRMPAV